MSYDGSLFEFFIISSFNQTIWIFQLFTKRNQQTNEYPFAKKEKNLYCTSSLSFTLKFYWKEENRISRSWSLLWQAYDDSIPTRFLLFSCAQ